jgi:hypothetical protein
MWSWRLVLKSKNNAIIYSLGLAPAETPSLIDNYLSYPADL